MMKETDINQNNDLIMRFMGCRLAPCSNGKAWETPNEYYGTEMGRMHGRLQQSAWNGMGFHRSWDWLMPVVAEIKAKPMHQQHSGNGVYYVLELGIDKALEAVDLDQVYRRVVEFIHWHNEEKAKEEAE